MSKRTRPVAPTPPVGPFCPTCDKPINKHTTAQLIDCLASQN